MLGSSFSVGDHVVATNDLDGWLGRLGCPAVKKGTRGIVREVPSGWFNGRYKVEFHRGGTVVVRGNELRRAWSGAHGEQQWKRYKDTKLGISLGLFVVFTLPVLIGLIPYYMHGGTTAELVAALPGAFLDGVVELVAAIGLPLTVLTVVVLWLRGRARR